MELGHVGFYLEWRYWLIGFGWRTHKQSAVGYRLTFFLGPVRIYAWKFKEEDL